MSTGSSPLVSPEAASRPSLKAPLILLAVLVGATAAGYAWVSMAIHSDSPVLHRTKDGWQRLPPVKGLPEKILVTPAGTVWVSTFGRHPLSYWKGAAWQSYTARELGVLDSSSLHIASDGEQLWVASREGVLLWDGTNWKRYPEAAADVRETIVAGAGQAWVVNRSGKLFHFDGVHWTTSSPTLSGMNWNEIRGVPRLARTADGTLWLVSRRVWRLEHDNWAAVNTGSTPSEREYLVGTTGNRLWLDDSAGLRSIANDGRAAQLYPPDQVGVAEDYVVHDITTDGKLIWLATSAGLLEFDGAHWKQVQGPSQDAGNVARIAAAPDGSMWVVSSPAGNALRRPRNVIMVVALLPLAIIGVSFWLFRRVRARRLAQHQRVTEAVLHATGDVPAELAVGERQIAKSGQAWVLAVVGVGIAYVLVHRIWPQAPLWIYPVLFVVLDVAITLWQSLVKRKQRPYDPIGPGAPSQYDWGNAWKSVAGAAVVLVLLNLDRLPNLRFLRGYMIWLILGVPIGYQALGVKLMNQALRRGDYEAALRIIRWFHFYNPSGAEALRLTGHAYLFAGRYSDAEDALRRSLSSARASQTYGTALERLGDALMEQGRYDEALRSYEAALHSFAWMRRPYRGITELHLRRGENTQALSTVEKIIDFDGLSLAQRKSNGHPQDDYWALKAWALARTGQSSQVATAIENALKAANPHCPPDVAAVHYRAGMAMQALGNMSEANRHFEQAVKLDPRGRFGTLAKAALHDTSVLRESSVWGTVEV